MNSSVMSCLSSKPDQWWVEASFCSWIELLSKSLLQVSHEARRLADDGLKVRLQKASGAVCSLSAVWVACRCCVALGAWGHGTAGVITTFASLLLSCIACRDSTMAEQKHANTTLGQLLACTRAEIRTSCSVNSTRYDTAFNFLIPRVSCNNLC